MLWLALYLPALALEALPATSGRPRAVLSAGRRGRLWAVDTAAAAAGVQSGMTATAALALLPDLELLARAPQAEAAAREALLLWCGQFTSHCTAFADDCLLLEIGASLRLFGGPAALIDHVRSGLAALVYRAQLATAPTPAAAALLARHLPGTQVSEPAALPGVLGAMPLACLDLDAALIERLQGFGLRSIGDCRRLPRAALARRVGPAVLASLDHLSGLKPQPLAPFNPPTQFRRELLLPAPVEDSVQLRRALARLLLELQGFLRARQSAVQSLRLELVCTDRQRRILALRLSRPSREAALLQTLLDERLQQERLPAPVARLLLVSESLVDGPDAAEDLFEATGAEPLPHLLDRLRARLGDGAVNGIGATADHRPERGWTYCAPGDGEAVAAVAGRPAWLLRAPQRLRVVVGAPCLDGRLTLLSGPERIEGGWWDGSDVVRDYYVACQVSGRRLWIYRERRAGGRWYLHGLLG